MKPQNKKSNALAEIQVHYSKKVNSNELELIKTSKDAEILLRNIWSTKLEYIEETYLLCLNRANRVLGYTMISAGGISSTIIDPKIVLQIALKTNSSGIILCHNHPSGNLKPSEADISITKKINEACKFLDLSLLDHIILTENNYFSFADNSLL